MPELFAPILENGLVVVACPDAEVFPTGFTNYTKVASGITSLFFDISSFNEMSFFLFPLHVPEFTVRSFRNEFFFSLQATETFSFIAHILAWGEIMLAKLREAPSLQAGHVIAHFTWCNVRESFSEYYNSFRLLSLSLLTVLTSDDFLYFNLMFYL